MTKRLFTTVMVLTICVMTTTAQKVEPTTENYLNAVEALDESDYELAKELLQQELKLRPNDGFVWEKLSNAYLGTYQIDSLQICLDKAIAYLPQNESEHRADIYLLRGVVGVSTENYDAALADLTQYQQLKPEDEDGYELKALVYKQMERHAESDAELKRLLQVEGVSKSKIYTLLASNMNERNDFAQALGYLDKAHELNRTSKEILVARSDAHLGLGQLDESITDAIAAFALDFDQEGFDQLRYLAADASRRATVLSRIRQELETTDNPVYLHYLEYAINSDANNKPETLRSLLRTYKALPNASLAQKVSEFFRGEELYELAYTYIEQAIHKEETDKDDLLALRLQRADLLTSLGRYQEAIDTLTALRPETDDPDLSVGVRLASIYDLMGQPKESIHILMGFDEETKKANYWNTMARMYLKDGNTSAARLCLDTSLKNDDDITDMLYAYALTGDRDKTLSAMRVIAESIADDNEETADETRPMKEKDIESTIHEEIGAYNMTCLYSLVGEKDKGLEYLKTALEEGWNDFGHLDRDSDLDNIRNEADFIALVKMYRTKNEKEREELLQVHQEEMENDVVR